MNELERKRKELGITQAEAARALGISRRSYQTYENGKNEGDVYEQLLSKLEEMGALDGSNVILGHRFIEQTCSKVFCQYPEVECAYLFGSYARKAATGKSDVSMAVKSLEEKGYLSKTKDPLDQRKSHLRLLGKADPLLKKIDAMRKDYFASLFKDFSPEEIALFKTLIERMSQNVHANE